MYLFTQNQNLLALLSFAKSFFARCLGISHNMNRYSDIFLLLHIHNRSMLLQVVLIPLLSLTLHMFDAKLQNVYIQYDTEYSV